MILSLTPAMLITQLCASRQLLQVIAVPVRQTKN